MHIFLNALPESSEVDENAAAALLALFLRRP